MEAVDPTLPSSPTSEHPPAASCFPPIPQSVIRELPRKVPFFHLPPFRVPTWHVPNYIWCSIFTAIGGFLFGFDTGSIGPVTVMTQFEKHLNGGGKIDPTIQGLIVSSILITASISSVASGPLSNRISRTRTMALGAITFAAGSAIVCACGPLAQLFVGRCIAGIGEGLFMSAITVYAIEIAPASSRGRLGSVLQLGVTLGIALGYFVCYGTSRISNSLSWRFPFGVQAIGAVVFAAGCPFLPHSPRWLHIVGRHDEARAAWEKLGVSAADIEKTEAAAQREQVQQGSFGVELKQMWQKGVRGRTALGVFLCAMQQLSGIDGVLYYAPVLFSQAGLSSNTASFLASGVSGLLNLGVTILCQPLADKWGRRPTTIRGGLSIALSMLVIGSLYASGASNSQSGRWVIIVLIYVFVVAFSSSWAMVIRIYCSEIQPTRTRAAVSSLGQCANWFVNWIVAFATPLFLAKSSSGPYFLFGGCSLFTTLICVAFQPETRDSSLEDVDQVFGESPWRKLLGDRHFSLRFGRDRPVAISPTHSRSPSDAGPEDMEDFEFDEIRLPEVSRSAMPAVKERVVGKEAQTV